MRRVSVPVNGSPMVGRRVPGPGRPSVVCVHGAGISSRSFRPFLAALGRYHDVWAVDLPGFGASEGPTGRMPLRALSDALARWLPATGPEPVVLLGGSFGCQVAVDVAVRHPDRVAGLVLVGPTVGLGARTVVRQLGRWLRNAPHERASLARLNIADYRDAGLRAYGGRSPRPCATASRTSCRTSTYPRSWCAEPGTGWSPRSGRRKRPHCCRPAGWPWSRRPDTWSPTGAPSN
ncbi:alpha/beta hydrolase [Streptomyces sp. ML-6]|uniref:alpha/beta fold hydrolase n=1 Tax=Streptomyces sp. ML-6 TaxID=2982693 RepID=UPI0024C050A0|nr:alpha/beta hydrolase [Streptomyces sp. ML-6]MDK0523887.1 alpha/beta hydrolase [Streptomyces sp. ML-6]